MGSTARVAPSARATGAAAPDLLQAALMCAHDECPPETAMQLCGMSEDYWDGCCIECWVQYLYWVYNGRLRDPYLRDRGMGLIG